MATRILLAGATGQLGGLIVDALLARGAEVCALVRPGTAPDKLRHLRDRASVAEASLSDVAALTAACAGAACVVSALNGLSEVIVDGQSALLDAAIAARVPRFIPSDFSSEFTNVPAGENRNFDIRRDFKARLDNAPIAATSILNGAFSYLLTDMPLFLNFREKRVTYWENADQRLEFTTRENVAEFTAAAALDATAPRVLRVAGMRISARELADLAGELKGTPFELSCLGSLADLADNIRRARSADPESEQQIFPRWQGMQYTHAMFSGAGELESIDNDRYPGIAWTNARDLLAA